MRLPRLGSSEKQCMKSVWNRSRAAAGLFKAIARQAFSWGLQPPSPCSRTFSKFWRPQSIIYVCVCGNHVKPACVSSTSFLLDMLLFSSQSAISVSLAMQNEWNGAARAQARQISGHKRGRSRMSVSPSIPHCYYTSIKHRHVSNPSITKEALQFGWLKEMKVKHSVIFILGH